MTLTVSTTIRLIKGAIVMGLFGTMLWTGANIAQGGALGSGCSGSGLCTGTCTPKDGGNGCCAADPSNNDKCTCYPVNSGCS